MVKEKIEPHPYATEIEECLFNSARQNNLSLMMALSRIKKISLNCVNNETKSLIAVWSESYNQSLSYDQDKIAFDAIEKLIVLINPLFCNQVLDIIKWCNLIFLKHCYEEYRSFAIKLIGNTPPTPSLVEDYQQWLFENMSVIDTAIIKAIVEISNLIVTKKNKNNLDLFQAALNTNNEDIISLFIPYINRLLDNDTSEKKTEYDRMIDEIYRCLDCFANGKINELPQNLINISNLTLELLQDSGEYPDNFSKLIFQLANYLTVIKVGSFNEQVISLRKLAADLGHTDAKRITQNFVDYRDEPSFNAKVEDVVLTENDSIFEPCTTIVKKPSPKFSKGIKGLFHVKKKSEDENPNAPRLRVN